MKLEDINAEFSKGATIYLEAPRIERLQELQVVIDHFGKAHRCFISERHRTTDINETRQNLDKAIKDFNDKKAEYRFFIIEKETNQLVGAISLWPRRLEIGFWQIGYWIATQSMDKGFATEACRLATQIAVTVFRAKRLELETAKTNIASQIVAESSGYHFEAFLRNRCMGLNGEPDDACIYTYPV